MPDLTQKENRADYISSFTRKTDIILAYNTLRLKTIFPCWLIFRLFYVLTSSLQVVAKLQI